ncbi:MAG TPA: CHAD domain-containing protein [Steroidobacteraceae bacterium]|nr:CHAD domain-containing protein [Steroidobacteraceae bacterium]
MISKAAKRSKTNQGDLALVFARQHLSLQRAATSVARKPSAEAVHRARVAARRLRALLEAFGERGKRVEVRRFKRDLRALALELAAIRQADVLREGMHEALNGLKGSHVPARRRMIALLDRECVAARRQFGTHAHSLAWGERLARLERSNSEVQALLRTRDPQTAARDMIVNSAQAFWRARRRADQSARRLHNLRIRAKAHRYVVDALAPFVGLDARQFSIAARAVQHGIGQHLDARYAREWLSSRSENVDRKLSKVASKHLRNEGRKALKQAQRRLRSLSS